MITLSIIFLSSCGPGIYVNKSTAKVWYVDASGVVQTNDLARLQRATPFKIILPTYLPAEVSSSPVMFTKTIGMNSKNDVDVQFSYWNSPNGITIEEVNYPLKWVPNNGDTYFQINGTKVLQMRSKNFVNGEVTVDVYSYAWYKNGVSFNVDVWDYSEAESRKIAEAMIK